MKGLDHGLAFDVPADTSPRVVRFYVGVNQAQGKLLAHMSDGSAPDLVDDSLLDLNGTSTRTYTIQYRAGSAGQTLTISWTVESGIGNVNLSAVMLSPVVPLGWVSLVSQNSSKCADISGISISPGALVHQWTCLGADNQKFRFVPTMGGYQVSVKNSALQLAIFGTAQNTDDGERLIQYPFDGQPNQVFNLRPMTDGTYEIIAKHSGKCLDVSGVSKEDGAAIQQWTCLNQPNQKWSFIP